MPELNTITGSQLHWPRGCDTAANGEVLVANGSAAGTWQDLDSLIAAYVDLQLPITKVKDGDTTKNNTATLADDDDLTSFSLEAGEVYKVDGVLHFTSANGTTGMQFAFQLVSGSIADSSVFYVASRPDDDNVTTSGAQAITSTATVAAPGGTSAVEVRLSGYVSVTNAAVLDLQIAQDSAAASDTILKEGSVITFTKVQS